MRWETNILGRVVARTNSYVELATGLHYQDPLSKDWRESDPSFELTKAGYAVALHCQHQVTVTPNLNSSDGVVVDLLTPDGQRLRSGIVGLNLYDPVSGNRLQVAAVRDVTGTLVSSNEIVWADAFDGLKADVRVRNERGQFHQDVLLKEQFATNTLATLGFDANTVRIEVWTEFLGVPAPTERRPSLSAMTNGAPGTLIPPDEVDPVLQFGSAMEIGPGKTFIEGERTKTTRVFKQWYQNSSRQWLIEAANYRELLPLLQALPVRTAALKVAPSKSLMAANRLNSGLKTQDSRLRTVLPGRARPSGKRASQTLKIVKLEGPASRSAGPRVVWDYEILNDTLADYTLCSDTTYYVSGITYLTGTATIEGGTVVKFPSYYSNVDLEFDGAVNCLTGPYRPAIFTAYDDDTVGEVLPDSSGIPWYYYALTALNGWGSPLGDLHDVQVRYAYQGIFWWGGPRLTNLQLLNCYYGIYRSFYAAPVHNVLLSNVFVAFVGGGINYDIEHVTVNQCSQLAAVSGIFGMPGCINLTNCVLANIGSWGTYNQLNANFNGRYNTPPLSEANDFPTSSSPFQSVGGGSHYLANNSPFRNVGTTNIAPDLLASVRQKTTYPPIVYSNLLISGNTTLGPQAQRDTDTPDLGYHYDPLDYAFTCVQVTNSALSLQPGTALAAFGQYGIGLLSGSQLVCQGTPTNRNHIVRFNTVQEGDGDSGGQGDCLVGDWLGGPAPAQARLRFTDFSMPALDGNHFLAQGSNTVFVATDCEFRGGVINVTTYNPCFTNDLFERVAVILWDATAPMAPLVRNCLFLGGTLLLECDRGSSWTLRDNLFDGVTITVAGSSVNGAFNGYTWETPFHIWPGNYDVTAGIAYQTGPLGKYYQPTNSAFLNKGSTTADQVGLYHYTVLTNQLKEATNTVSIGYHYVAVDANGNPIDSNGDGIPDYLADANGNGLVDPGEIAWQSAPLDPPPDGCPTNILLDSWSFTDTTNWLSDRGYWPVSFTNLNWSDLGDGPALVVDSPQPAWLRYNVFEQDGRTNLTVANGSVAFWFAPYWSGTNQGGTGPGQWSRLIEVGAYTTNASYGWWSLYVDPAGANLYFSAQGNDGSQTNYLTVPIAWTTNMWHLIVLTYSTATNCSLYLDGEWVTNGPPTTCVPGPNVLAEGFCIGSDSNGLNQAQGMFDDLQTYANPLDPGTVWALFDWGGAPYYLNPDNVANLDPAPSYTTNAPTFRAVMGPGYLTYVGPASPCVTNANVWITNIVATNIKVLATNSMPATNYVNVAFEIRGGSNSLPYDVFASPGLVGQSITNATWTWMGQGYSCTRYGLTNLPPESALLILGTPIYLSSGLTVAYELLVGKVNPDPNVQADSAGVSYGWYAQHGLVPITNGLANLDSNTNGLLNWQEYLWGSDPTAQAVFSVWVASPAGYNGIP